MAKYRFIKFRAPSLSSADKCNDVFTRSDSHFWYYTINIHDPQMEFTLTYMCSNKAY